MIENPAEAAIAALREHQKQMGMTFGGPDVPVTPSPGYERDEEFG